LYLKIIESRCKSRGYLMPLFENPFSSCLITENVGVIIFCAVIPSVYFLCVCDTWCLAVKGEIGCCLFQNVSWKRILGHEKEGETGVGENCMMSYLII
jgi:hypothetical protein